MRNVKEYQAIFDRLADGLREKARGLKGRLDDAFESDYEQALEVITEMIGVFTRLKTLSDMGGPFVSLLESIDQIETLREEIVDRAGQLGPEFLRYREHSQSLHDLGIGEFEQLFASETGDPDFRFDLSLDGLDALDCIRRLAPEAFGDTGPLSSTGAVEPTSSSMEATARAEEPTAVVDPLGTEPHGASHVEDWLAGEEASPHEEELPAAKETDAKPVVAFAGEEAPAIEEPVPSEADYDLDAPEIDLPELIPGDENPLEDTASESLIGLLQEEPPAEKAGAAGDDLEDEVRKELERIRSEGLGAGDDADDDVEDEVEEDPFAKIFQNSSTSDED